MKFSTFITSAAIVAGAFGVAFVLAPGTVISYYSTESGPMLSFMGQLFGGSLFAFAVLLWSARNVTGPEARRIVVALFVADFLGFILSLIAQLGGVVNALGWSTVGIYLFYSIGFAYFLVKKPAH
jgi:hypothetical protein